MLVLFSTFIHAKINHAWDQPNFPNDPTHNTTNEHRRHLGDY